MRIVPGPSRRNRKRSIKFCRSTRRQVDAVVLSHSHLDHAGKLPSLCKTYDGPIHCTSATNDLCGIMLLDSAHIQEQDAHLCFQSPRAKNISRRSSRFTPRPTRRNACSNSSRTITKNRFQPVPGVTVTFRDAGHILGSAQVILDVQENGTKIPLSVHRRHRPRRR